MDKNVRAFLAELIGTFAVVLLAAAAVCGMQAAFETGPTVPGPSTGPVWQQVLQPGLLVIALVYAIIYAVALAITLNFSEGFLNPAVSVMLWAYKRLDTGKMVILILAQLLGAGLAGGLIRAAFPTIVLVNGSMGTPHLNYRAFGWSDPTEAVGFRVLPGVALEFGLTFVLTFVILGTIIDSRSRRSQPEGASRGLATLWVGLALFVMTLAGYWLTGAAANPARWFGTVCWEKRIEALNDMGPFRDQVIYWLGPIAGALAAGGLYITLLLPKEEAAATTVATGSRVPTGASATLFRSRR